ncbi:MAG: PP0621 family protein [Pseudomonadales bacterium]
MGFIGLIRLIALAAAVWLVWRYVARRKATRTAEPRIDQKVVACAICGTHVPETDALSDNGQSYCCSKHLEQAVAERDKKE